MIEPNKTTELLCEIFSDKLNIEVLCSIYDKKLSANQISVILNIPKIEAIKLLEHLFQIGVISKTIIDETDCFFLLQPKICDSIMMLKDALYNIKFVSKQSFQI